MRKLLVLLLLVIIAAKVAAVFARGPAPIERDSLGYWRLSALVMKGDLLMLQEPIAYRTPGYPWFVAVIRTATESIRSNLQFPEQNGAAEQGAAEQSVAEQSVAEQSVAEQSVAEQSVAEQSVAEQGAAGQRAGPLLLHELPALAFIQALLCFFSVCIAAHIAGRITKLPSAVPCTLAVALPAVTAYTYSAAVLSESLFVFLLMLNLLAVLDYAKYGTPVRAVWVGITFAAALLTRPVVLFVWIPHILFLLYIHFRKRRRLGKAAPGRIKLHHRVGHVLIAALTVGVLISPWLMRNYSIFGQPLLTEFVGRNVWVVTFQDGSGAGLELPDSESSRSLQKRLASVDAGDDWRATWAVSNALVKSGLDDVQADRLMRQVALDAIEADQEAFAYKAFRRVVNFWRCAATDILPQGPATEGFHGQRMWGWEVPPIDMAIEHRWSQSVMLNTVLAAVLGAATLLLIVNFPTRPYGLWMLLIFAYFSIVTGILEIPAYRYRIVLEPLVATTIGSAIAVLLARRRKPADAVT